MKMQLSELKMFDPHFTPRLALPRCDPIPPDFVPDELKYKAEHGDPEAQYQFALLHEYGIGVSYNMQKRLELLKLAADNNHTNAMAMLGMHYYMGTHGADVNQNLALKYLRKAASMGNDCAITDLGLIAYLNKNLEKAITYLHEGDKLGNSRAQFALAQFYIVGYDGIKIDYDKGIEFLQKANDSFLSDAAYFTALLYNSGKYCFEKNQEIALEYLYKSFIDTKTPFSRLLYSAYLIEGKVVPQDLHSAMGVLNELYMNYSQHHGQLGFLFREFHALVMIYLEKARQDKRLREQKAASVKDKINLWKRDVLIPADSAKSRLSILKQLAEENNIEAEILLGDYYSKNDTVRSLESAKIWYEKASLQNNAYAQAEYARLLVDEFSVYTPKAFDLATKSAKQGCAFGYYLLGEMYYFGMNVEPDYAQAIEYFNKYIELRTLDYTYLNYLDNAYYFLGRIYLEGNDDIKNEQKAFEMFSEARKYGSSDAEFYITMMYENGIYVKQDGLRAFNIMYSFVHRNKFFLADKLANFYIEGKYVKRNINTAIFYLQKGIEKNYALPKFNLAKIYFAGFDHHRNPSDGFDLLAEAAHSAEPNASFTLGLVYDLGYLDKQDDDAAIMMYKMAILNRNTKALVNLSVKYLNGEGCDINEKEAFNLCRRAAKLSNPIGEANLALMYRCGIGTLEDKYESNRWFKSAADHGDNFAGEVCSGKINLDYEKDPKKYFRKVVVQDYLNFEELVNGTYKTPTEDEIITQDPIPLYCHKSMSHYRQVDSKYKDLYGIGALGDLNVALPDFIVGADEAKKYYDELYKITEEIVTKMYGEGSSYNISREFIRLKRQFIEEENNKNNEVQQDQESEETEEFEASERSKPYVSNILNRTNSKRDNSDEIKKRKKKDKRKKKKR